MRKLLQERDMELEGLVRRLMEDGRQKAEEEGEEKLLIEVIVEKPAADEGDEGTPGTRTAKKRRVCFAASDKEKTSDPPNRVGTDRFEPGAKNAGRSDRNSGTEVVGDAHTVSVEHTIDIPSLDI